MNRILLKRCKFATLLSFFGIEDMDAVVNKTRTEQLNEIDSNETGLDRLIKIFKADEFNTMSPELSSIVQVSCMSIFTGGLYGGVMSSRTAYMDFMRNNQATAFKDHLHAKKLLQEKVTLSFAKGAYNWSWRLTLFSTSYTAISTMISVYRGKHGIFEHMVAGATTGFIYKFSAGPRAWLVGSGLGLVLGTVAGSVTYGILSYTGLSMDQVRYWQYRWKEKREQAYKDTIRSQMEGEKMFLERDAKLGPPPGLETIPNS
ncbi:RPII140-upstream gene protein [Onthophagus taurus]|uniref:RPII140-upstream gene protein n=1 Tax=Onthophagus taurus TaxID=166361 RepID=UPI000C20A980|nr:RPII140-upstream gene protein [Onthophagus taurus]